MQVRLKKMMTFSKNSGQMEKGQKSARKRISLQLLVLVGLGAMLLTFSCLLSGCGSDSKTEKATASDKARKQMPARLVMEEGKAPGEAGKIKPANKMPELRPTEIVVAPDEEVFPGVTRKELEARLEESRKKGPPDMEIFPGITRKEVEARIEESRKKGPPDMEIFPGMTKKEMEARMSAQRGRDPRTMEVIPGVTREELNAKKGREVGPTKQEMFPPSGGK
jgi:hypothetical protein